MLHIVNKSPLERPSLDACLRIAEPGSILLIEDAVYAAARGSAAAARIDAAMSDASVASSGLSRRTMDSVLSSNCPMISRRSNGPYGPFRYRVAVSF